MPTYLRLIIMLGEIIGFIVFSIIRINYYRNNMRSDLKGISIYYIILNVMLVSTFFFSFPTKRKPLNIISSRKPTHNILSI